MNNIPQGMVSLDYHWADRAQSGREGHSLSEPEPSAVPGLTSEDVT